METAMGMGINFVWLKKTTSSYIKYKSSLDQRPLSCSITLNA